MAGRQDAGGGVYAGGMRYSPVVVPYLMAFLWVYSLLGDYNDYKSVFLYFFYIPFYVILEKISIFALFKPFADFLYEVVGGG